MYYDARAHYRFGSIKREYKAQVFRKRVQLTGGSAK